ncbi:hypothetical protein [Campylobacter ureolyticus]|uniref:Uncharacterized protein n=1 Tax=Campylobacter ureolyticus TaxID=827 RepID=A0A9Q4PRI6_9BACT|nr:hypothetical protein [Campylobacter ureolyticus]MCZ6158992.1 hypothetical protein [Campylobacter ureolyticus]
MGALEVDATLRKNVKTTMMAIEELEEELAQKYDNLRKEIFIELNKYFSFMGSKTYNTPEGKICYEEEKDGIKEKLMVEIFLSEEERKNNNKIILIEIKHDRMYRVISKILSEFCENNNLLWFLQRENNNRT